MPSTLSERPITQPSVLDLVDPLLYSRGDPHAIWHGLREHDPICWHEPARGIPGFWVVTRHQDVAAILNDPATYSSAKGILLRPASHGADPGGGSTLALTDPPHHRNLRSIMKGWFVDTAVRQIKARINAIAADVIDKAAENSEVEFVGDVAARLPLYVICDLMGVPDEDREQLFAWTSQAFCSDDPKVQSLSHVSLMGYLAGLADERRGKAGDDIVTVLANAEIDGRPLTDHEVLLNCDNLLVGGTENVRITAAGGLLQFIRQPASWQALRAEPKLVGSAVEEVLRWTSTPTHLMRTVRVQARLGERSFKPGDRVTVWIPSANRDDRVFANPYDFDITRAPNRHLALGTGEHFCIGGLLARVELHALYSELLSRFRSVELAGEPALISSIVVSGPRSLPVRLVH